MWGEKNVTQKYKTTIEATDINLSFHHLLQDIMPVMYVKDKRKQNMLLLYIFKGCYELLLLI